jgi:hypothetical protein
VYTPQIGQRLNEVFHLGFQYTDLLQTFLRRQFQPAGARRAIFDVDQLADFGKREAQFLRSELLNRSNANPIRHLAVCIFCDRQEVTRQFGRQSPLNFPAYLGSARQRRGGIAL